MRYTAILKNTSFLSENDHTENLNLIQHYSFHGVWPFPLFQCIKCLFEVEWLWKILKLPLQVERLNEIHSWIYLCTHGRGNDANEKETRSWMTLLNLKYNNVAYHSSSTLHLLQRLRILPNYQAIASKYMN